MTINAQNSSARTLAGAYRIFPAHTNEGPSYGQRHPSSRYTFVPICSEESARHPSSNDTRSHSSVDHSHRYHSYYCSSPIEKPHYSCEDHVHTDDASPPPTPPPLRRIPPSRINHASHDTFLLPPPSPPNSMDRILRFKNYQRLGTEFSFTPLLPDIAFLTLDFTAEDVHDDDAIICLRTSGAPSRRA